MVRARRWTGTILAGLLFAAGCTVQPLYQSGAPDAGVSSTLSSIAVEEVDNRLALKVRNELIFLLRGGSATTMAPLYLATLDVTADTDDLLDTIAMPGEVDVTARRVTVTGTLTLRRAEDGAVVLEETRRAAASIDVTTQEFANRRALRDAENRAARVLARQLHAVVAARLASGRTG
ncbi:MULTISPECIES: LPS assembly lipoprotein LptE [unclassified Roseitalea]|uniref:LPS assembly lipoprotein LptE n=1 Tax=unclassified Roseitalea TaxID=2639107 RepID=UPI00273F1692|nr:MULTISPECIES: LPS assembly lipoprotein LptE [unclassified Roseitalea]